METPVRAEGGFSRRSALPTSNCWRCQAGGLNANVDGFRCGDCGLGLEEHPLAPARHPEPEQARLPGVGKSPPAGTERWAAAAESSRDQYVEQFRAWDARRPR